MHHLNTITGIPRSGAALGIPELLASIRALEDQIGIAEGDIAHFRFEAAVAEILDTDIDLAANEAAIREARWRLAQLRDEHAEAMQRIGAPLAEERQ